MHRYGGVHKRKREELLRQLAATPGLPCCRCGGPMTADMPLHLDHLDDGSGRYNGPFPLAHASCNLKAGQRLTTAVLKVKGYKLSQRQLNAVRAKSGRVPVPEGPVVVRRRVPASPATGRYSRW